MKRASGKSHCPINFSLEILGDPWALLIMRDIILFRKRRYKEFMESEEAIATNILADRLARLEEQGIVEKMCDVYLPTEKGLDLVPLLTEMALWGARHDPRTAAPQPLPQLARNDRSGFRKLFRKLSGNP